MSSFIGRTHNRSSSNHPNVMSVYGTFGVDQRMDRNPTPVPTALLHRMQVQARLGTYRRRPLRTSAHKPV